jgi:hypothetical protein
MHVEDPPPSLRKKRPDVSRRLERVISKCLAKHADDRYRDAAALLADLEEVEARRRTTGSVGRAPAGSEELPASRERARRPWAIIVAAAVGLTALVALVVSLMR